MSLPIRAFAARAAIRPVGCTLLALGLAMLLASNALGVALETGTFGTGPRGDGFGAPGTDFLRWQNAAVLGRQTITYSFTQSFVDTYGLAGEAKITADLNQWAAKVTLAALPAGDISAPFNPVNDIALKNTSGSIYDLQSVALHEIGHVLGLDHPDVASGLNPNTTEINNVPLPTPGTPGDPTLANYNVNIMTSDFQNGALVAGEHPVMWSVLAAGVDRQSLTYDDVYGIQYLYTAGAGGAGTGAALGPSFGGGTPFNFSMVNNGGNVVFDAAPLGGTTLASTNVTTAPGAGGAGDAPYVASSALVVFQAPEPSTYALLLVGMVLIGLRRLVRR